MDSSESTHKKEVEKDRDEKDKSEEGEKKDDITMQSAETLDELEKCLGVNKEPTVSIMPSDSIPPVTPMPTPTPLGLDSQAPGNVVNFPDIAGSLRMPKPPHIKEPAEQPSDEKEDSKTE